MGRYYSGDIEGKFWFGVQPSNDANFFGKEGQPFHLEYYFEKNDLPKIQSGIDTCLKELGDMKTELDKFFDAGGAGLYSKEILQQTFDISKEEAHRFLEWYARLELGNEILKCVKENSQCTFSAEL
tara:strand:+ start:1840 stop:2217 length:378 start_codon:yes stop_codon:yes gene_type:complete